MRDIDTLIAFVAAHHQFNGEKYPELLEKDEKQRLIFALRHTALHFSKTAGKIAAVSERVDHGEDIDVDELRINTSKALANTLRLAELIGLSGDDLVHSLEENYKDKV
jgi:hypothetical protein